jgi:DsbC/DsbD-like thiol-disulfide interchange protein
MKTILLSILVTVSALAQPVEVRHDDELCVAYQARIDGPYLVVQATLGAGWHTFAMDNKLRAEEKLAGKPALSIDRATEITGIETEGPWYQTPPKDFSRPELRWFSWGFDRQALFVAKLKRAAPTLTLKGQACTEKICKNVDVSIPVPAAKSSPAPDLKSLVQVR